ncbi:MAG TPA: biotin/lipoyl-containing protein, partial [Solirubrobacteraceae bacterium]|nr:biotin/lipoyl-containing protein [Solirubrobacteraceae bacterium]
MATSTTAEQTIDVVTPAAGESVTEGTILEWRVKVGDPIKRDDTVVEISTDKVDLELPSPASGVVTEILVEEGETVTVGQVIARISAGDSRPGESSGNGGAAAGEDAAARAATATVPDAAQSASPQGQPPASSQESSAETGKTAPGAKATPVAARAAAVEGVDLARVRGSGPDGRITKSDVLASASGEQEAGAGAAASANGATAAASAEAQPLRGGAAALARYMEESRSIPTATSFRTLTVTALDARRRELKAAGKRVSFTHLIAYAIAR